MIKSIGEINKAVWIVMREKDNRIIDKFRSKNLAEQKIKKLNKEGLETYKLKRDDRWRFKLKEKNKNARITRT